MAIKTASEEERPLIHDFKEYLEIQFQEHANATDVESLAKTIAIHLQKNMPVVLIPKKEDN